MGSSAAGPQGASSRARDMLRQRGFRPKLREDLTFFPSEQPQILVIRDPVNGKRHPLYQNECLLAQELDGTRTMGELMERATIYLDSVTREQLDSFLLQLANLGLMANLPADPQMLRPEPVKGTDVEYVTFRHQLLEELGQEGEETTVGQLGPNGISALADEPAIAPGKDDDALEDEPTRIGQRPTSSSGRSSQAIVIDDESEMAQTIERSDDRDLRELVERHTGSVRGPDRQSKSDRQRGGAWADGERSRKVQFDGERSRKVQVDGERSRKVLVDEDDGPPRSIHDESAAFDDDAPPRSIYDEEAGSLLDDPQGHDRRADLDGHEEGNVLPSSGAAIGDDELSSALASLQVGGAGAPAPRKSRVGLIVGILLVCGLGVGAYFGYGRMKGQVFAPNVETSEVGLVSPAQSSTLLTATGYVVPETVSKVGARVPGRVAVVNVKEGDQVKKGDVIVKLDDSEQMSAIRIAQARVSAAAARVKTAKAAAAELRQQISREKPLVERKMTPRATLEDLEARQRSLLSNVSAASAEVSAAISEVNALKVNLEHMTIHAPIDGKITSKPVAVGELVGPTTGPVAEIADFTSLVVEVDVPERSLGEVKTGSPCEIVLDAFSDKRYRGETIEVGQKINRAKGTVRVKVKFIDPMDRVLPEMSARVSFLNKQLSADAMKEPPKKVVPAAAVVERQGGKFIFVVDQGKAKLTPIQVGGRLEGGVVLTEGPPPGTRIVSPVPPNMVDGQAIKEKQQ